MSKYDLLTPLEESSARSQGWMLCEVFDLGKKRLNRQVLPVSFCKATPHCAAMTARVVALARAGDRASLRALQLITQGHRK